MVLNRKKKGLEPRTLFSPLSWDGSLNAGVEKRHPWADARVRHETGHTVQVGLPDNNSWHEERSQISSGSSAMETSPIVKCCKTLQIFRKNWSLGSVPDPLHVGTVQIRGSVTCWYESVDLYLWLIDPAPDPDPETPEKKILVFCLLFEGTFTSFFKDKKS